MSYLSTAPLTQRVQLKVQLVEVVLGDTQIVSTSGSTVTIDCGQTVGIVREALNISNSLATVVPIQAANRVISGNTVTLTLANPLAANDSIQLYFDIKSPSGTN